MDSEVTIHAYNRANYLTRKVHEMNPQADMDQMKRLGKALFEVLEPFYQENVKKYRPLVGTLMSGLDKKKERYIKKQLTDIDKDIQEREMEICAQIINSWAFKENLEPPKGN